MNIWQKRAPGVLLCLAVALLAWFLVELAPALEIVGSAVLAILFGMVLCAVMKNKDKVKDGVAFTSKKVLQYAVILLGFGLNLRKIGEVGLTSLPIILSTIATSLIVAFLMSRALHMPGKIATLIGVGSSICGGSAIAATAPVIEADDEEIAQSISVIFLFNVLAALIFPTLGGAIGLSDTGFGLFAGTAVNDTSSVTAAASTWDTLHNTGGAVLEYATIVKLTRTLAIIPITLALALFRRAPGGEGRREERREGCPPSRCSPCLSCTLCWPPSSLRWSPPCSPVPPWRGPMSFSPCSRP